ncbi:MAG: NFACT family protein [Candidatus Marsarchaeota archaeon]|nr:NFACT family protein [Candidatus Marsarchaeota archaeon]
MNDTMREPSTLDLATVINELEPLIGFYVEKFYELPGQRFRLKLNKSGTGQGNLLITPGRMFGVASQVEISDTPTSFSQAVRKRISNSKITAISLFNDDRIISIAIDKGDTRQYLIVEMFGKGNLIIADSGMKIALAYKRHEFQDRKVFPGEQYVAPKNKPVTISALGNIDRINGLISEACKKPGKSVMQALSSVINLGSLYIEDSAIRCGVDPASQANELHENHIDEITKQLSKFSTYIKSPEPTVYIDGETAIDYSVAPIKKYESMQQRRFGHAYEAMEYYYMSVRETPEQNESTKAKELEASIKKQHEIISKTAGEIEQLKRSGDLIYANMQLINDIISRARSLKRFDKAQIEGEFGVKVANVDLKEKKITLEL